MKHLFLPYELAKIAKEKGFNEECFTFFHSDRKINIIAIISGLGVGLPLSNTRLDELDKGYIAVPLYQQIIDWFREKHKIEISIMPSGNSGQYFYQLLFNSHWSKDGDFKSYYEALNKAIEKAFNLI